MVGMAEIGLGKERFDERTLGIVLRAKTPFFLHHLPLRFQLAHFQYEPLHAVSFKLQGQFDAVGCEILEIGGEVLAREGVIHASVLANETGEGAFRVFDGTLEHHMFQHVGKACTAHDFVA